VFYTVGMYWPLCSNGHECVRATHLFDSSVATQFKFLIRMCYWGCPSRIVVVGRKEVWWDPCETLRAVS
jgi:hypothetical protein